MSTLMVHEIYGSALIQQFRTPNDGLVREIAAIRPHLYIQGGPSGQILVRLQNTSTVGVLADADLVTVSSITSATYFHGYVTFDINATVQPNTVYQISVGASGATWTSASFVGWVTDHDKRKYSPNYTPATDAEYPLDFEIWERKVYRRGI